MASAYDAPAHFLCTALRTIPPNLSPFTRLIRGQLKNAVQRKLRRLGVWCADDKQPQEARQMRHVTNEHDMTALFHQEVERPAWRVVWLQPACRTELCVRLACVSKQFGGLTCP